MARPRWAAARVFAAVASRPRSGKRHPRAQRDGFGGRCQGHQSLHQVLHEMDLARGFRPQVHDQVGAAEGQTPGARTGGGDLETIVVAEGGFQAEDQFNAGRAAYRGRLSRSDMMASIAATCSGVSARVHHNAVKPGPHRRR